VATVIRYYTAAEVAHETGRHRHARHENWHSEQRAAA